MQFQLRLAAGSFFAPARPFNNPYAELSFRTDYVRDSYGFALALSFAGMMITLGYVLIDAWSPQVAGDPAGLQWLRALIGLACAASFAALLLIPRWALTHQSLTVFVPTIIALTGLSLLIYLIRPHARTLGLSELSTLTPVAAVWMVAAFSRLQLGQMMAVSLAASSVTLLASNELGGRELPLFALELVVTNIAVWALTVQIEKRERLLWYRGRRAHRSRRAARPAPSAGEAFNLTPSRLMRAVGDDIRQPLLSSSVYLGAVSRAAHESAHDVVDANVERLRACLRVIEDPLQRLLDRPDPVTGESELATHRVNLAALLGDLRDVFEPQARAQDVSLRFLVAGASVQMARSNERAIREVLGNLIGNAIKYSALRQEHRPTVLVGLVGIGEALRVDVLDNGIGIPGHLHKQIFQAHFRAPDVADTPGTGLGLAIVETLIQRLPDHRLQLASEVGCGTRIRLYLPRA